MVEAPLTDNKLQAALSSTRRTVQADLDRLLAERGQLATWQQIGAPPDAEPALGEALAKVDAAIGHLLARWGQMGGGVDLRPPAHFGRGASPPVVTRRRSATPLMMAPGRASSRGYEGTSAKAIQNNVDTDWRTSFAEVMGQMGPGQDLAGELDIVIEASVSCDRWSRWPKYVQRHLVGLLACRLRGLQDEQGVPEYELQDGFSALTRFSKRVKPGFVFGLSRGHRPQHGASWDDDSERHWDQLTALIPAGGRDTDDQTAALDGLRDLVGERAKLPAGDKRDLAGEETVRQVGRVLEAGIDSRDPRLVTLAASVRDHLDGRAFKRLRRALADAAEAEVDPAGSTPTIDGNWGWGVHTRGQRVVIVGDALTDADAERLKGAFGFSEVERLSSTDGPGPMTDLAKRVRTGATDLVLLFGVGLGASADHAVLPIARDRKIGWALVDHGRSVARVRSAIERFLEREGEATL